MSCALEALKLLPKEVLSSMSQLSSAARSSLVVLKAQKTALARSLDIQLIPLQAKKLVLDKVVGGLRESTKVVPTETLLKCPELGKVNIMLEQSIVGSVEGALNTVFEIDRMLSLKAEVNASISEIDSAIAYFDTLIADIDAALVG